MKDLNSRIKQLTKLILTSQTVEESSRPGSPVKIDFDMSPYQVRFWFTKLPSASSRLTLRNPILQLQQELLSTRREIDSQAVQILALENALRERPLLPPDAPESEKDNLIMEQGKTIRELEIVVQGYEDNLGEPLRAVREDVENEWQVKLDEEVKKRQEKEAWADELVKQLEREKKVWLVAELTCVRLKPPPLDEGQVGEREASSCGVCLQIRCVGVRRVRTTVNPRLVLIYIHPLQPTQTNSRRRKRDLR